MPGRGAGMKSKKVGDILPGVMKGLGLDVKFREADLIRRWPEIVGETMALRSKPIVIKDRILLVAAENNVWMQEIRYHQRGIIEKIREVFPELEVEGLRLLLERERGAE
jgi:predicted nucleic acid-binding Zn ribbon protein